MLAIEDTVQKALSVSAERIHIEVKKTLLSSRAGVGLMLLAQGGLLDGPLRPVSQATDVELDRVRWLIDDLPTDWPMRLACIATLAGDYAVQLFSALKVSNKDKAMALLYLDAMNKPIPRDVSDSMAYLAILGREHWRSVLKFLAVMQPNMREQLDQLRKRIVDSNLETLPLTTQELAVNGRTLMTRLDLEPSRQIGIILKRLLTMVWSGTIANEDADLLMAAKGLVTSIGADT